jgi:hypothetical protein
MRTNVAHHLNAIGLRFEKGQAVFLAANRPSGQFEDGRITVKKRGWEERLVAFLGAV